MSDNTFGWYDCVTRQVPWCAWAVHGRKLCRNLRERFRHRSVIKGDGGAIGITDQESAHLWWMVAGPQRCMLPDQYEDFSGIKDKVNTTPWTYTSCTKGDERCAEAHKTLEEMGNPCFEESRSDLLTIDKKDVTGNKVTDMLKAYIPEGVWQFTAFRSNLQNFNLRFKETN